MHMKLKTAAKRSRVDIIRPISLFVLLIAGGLTIPSCSQNNHSQPEKEMSQNIRTEKDLTAEQQLDWYTFLQEWQINEFNGQLKTLGFRQDCVDCSNIVWTMQLSVDEAGKLTNLDIVNRDIQCPNKSKEQIQELENKVIESFKQQKFPTFLKSMITELKVGRASKC